MPLDAGAMLGAYRIIRPLGEGGMGRVYEAEHAELRIRRALKVFSTESKQYDLLRKRFVAEGRMLADLQHPRIVRVYDFAIDAESGTPYFAMDLVVSPLGVTQTLEDACRNGVTEEQVSGWFRDICEGLGYIHSKGVIHRDISLDNILIGRDGHAVIGDFGIAKITGEEYRRKIDVTVTMPLPAGEVLRWGKGLYLAPELQKGAEASPASDAYALGVLLFRLLAGSWYTPETRLEDMMAGMDYNWASVIGRLCAPDPRDRLAEGGLASATVGLRRLHVTDSKRRRLLFVGGLVVSVVVVLLLFFLRTRPEPTRSVRFGDKASGRKSAELTPAQIDALKNDIIPQRRPKER